MKAQQLRNAVLQLAIQGKIVPQNPMDEPASVLLERIKVEREQLIKDKKIKRERTLPEINDEEKTFDIPESWEWIWLDEIIFTIPTKQYQIQQKEIKETGRYPVISQSLNLIEGYSDIESKVINLDNPIIIFGDHTKCIKLIDFNFIVGADGVKIISGISINHKFLYYLLKFVVINMTDRGYSRHFQFLKENILALPPLAEQDSIVAKIEELLPMIDQYEELETKLFKLEADFPKNLKKSILQYAVEGKLVEQNKDDEPASVLLEQIKTKKEQLIKDKKIKSEKPLSEITDNEIPYELPNGWEWVRLGELCKVVDYGSSTKASTENIGVPILRMNNIVNGNVDFTNLKYVNVDIDDLPKLFLEDGDLIFNRTNSYELVGKTGLFTEQMEQYTFASYLIRCTLINCDPVYINYYMNSNIYRKTQIEPKIIQQNGQANFNGTKLKETLVPIPPLAEQQRIVARVDELLALCDVLSDKKALNNHMPLSKTKKVIEFKPQIAELDEEHAEKFDMVARAEIISPETQVKMAERIKLLRSKK